MRWLDGITDLMDVNLSHLMRRVDSLEKTLMLGGIGGRRRRLSRVAAGNPGFTRIVLVASGSFSATRMET